MGQQDRYKTFTAWVHSTMHVSYVPQLRSYRIIILQMYEVKCKHNSCNNCILTQFCLDSI